MRKMLYWGGAIAGTIGLGALLFERAFWLPRRLAAVPWELTARAVIPGIPGARYLVGVDIGPFVQDVVAARHREEQFLTRSGHTGPLPPADLLAISGGGDKGPSERACSAAGASRETVRRSRASAASAPGR